MVICEGEGLNGNFWQLCLMHGMRIKEYHGVIPFWGLLERLEAENRTSAQNRVAIVNVAQLSCLRTPLAKARHAYLSAHFMSITNSFFVLEAGCVICWMKKAWTMASTWLSNSKVYFDDTTILMRSSATSKISQFWWPFSWGDGDAKGLLYEWFCFCRSQFCAL